MARLIGGKHPYHVEDDVLCLAVRGVFDQQDMAEFLGAAEQVLTQHPNIYLLGNLREMSELTLGARKYTAHWLETHRCAGVSYYGTSFITRAIVILVSRGINLLTHSSLPVGISQDEQEARQWIARQRLRRQRQSSPGA